MKKQRTIFEILIDADNNSTDFNYLRKLITETNEQIDSLSIEEFEFMNDHFNKYIMAMPNYDELIINSIFNN